MGIIIFQWSVPDPWFGGEEGFHEVFGMIGKACDTIIEKSTTYIKQTTSDNRPLKNNDTH